MRKYNRVFDKSLSRFVSLKVLEEKIERFYNEKMLSTEDDVYKSVKNN